MERLTAGEIDALAIATDCDTCRWHTPPSGIGWVGHRGQQTFRLSISGGCRVLSEETPGVDRPAVFSTWGLGRRGRAIRRLEAAMDRQYRRMVVTSTLEQHEALLGAALVIDAPVASTVIGL